MTEWYFKPWSIRCCQDGTLTVARRGRRSFNKAALPVWGTDTREEADKLIVTCGSLATGPDGRTAHHPQLPGQPWMRVDVFGPVLRVEDLQLVTERFALAEALLARKRGGT